MNTLSLLLLLCLFITAKAGAGSLSDSATQELLSKLKLPATTVHEVKDLINSGADVNAIAPTAFSSAGKNCADYAPNSALMLAATNSLDGQVIQVLISAGANVEYAPTEDAGLTALYCAASFNSRADVTSVLLKSGLRDPNKVSAAFFSAAKLNRNAGPVLKSFMDVGLNAEGLGAGTDPDNFSSTPLYDAAYYGNASAVRFLIQAGADTKKTPGGYKETPLLGALSCSWDDFGHFDIIKELAQKSDIQYRAETGFDALSEAAAFCSDPRIIHLLAHMGGEVNQMRAYGDKNWIDYGYGATPLMLAANSGNVEIVEALIEEGANLKVKNNNNHDALAIAQMRLSSQMSYCQQKPAEGGCPLVQSFQKITQLLKKR